MSDPSPLLALQHTLATVLDRPNAKDAWHALEQEAASLGSQASSLLRKARARALEMHDVASAIRILALEARVAPESERQGLLLRRARLLDEELLDDVAALAGYRELPGVLEAEDAVERITLRTDKWAALVERYESEAASATEPGFRASLLAAAAETSFRHWVTAKRGKKKTGLESVRNLATEALELDPANARAFKVLVRTLTELELFPDLGQLLAQQAQVTQLQADRVALLIAAARVFYDRLEEFEIGIGLYREVLELDLTHSGAVTALADAYTSRKDWNELAALYEGQVATALLSPEEENGALMQAAMVHFRMRKDPERALPLFERLRATDPAHPGVLDFFRALCEERQDWAALAEILGQAQRHTSDPTLRATLEKERADVDSRMTLHRKKREKQFEALRLKPNDVRTLSDLRDDYRKTGELDAWAEFLGTHLDRIDDPALRESILLELVQLYRTDIPREAKLRTSLELLVELRTNDIALLRELHALYKGPETAREQLAIAQRIAALEPEGVRAEALRKVAQRWVSEFGNANNAIEAYTLLRKDLPRDAEAIRELRDLYAKRRAHGPLIDLLESLARDAEMEPQCYAFAMEAAVFAENQQQAERAISLYRRALECRPSDPAALVALEKHAQASGDASALMAVYTEREAHAKDDAERLDLLLRMAALAGERLKDAAAEEKAYRSVLRLDPAHPRASLYLREVLLSRGETDELESRVTASAEVSALADAMVAHAEKSTNEETKGKLLRRALALTGKADADPTREQIVIERLLEIEPTNAVWLGRLCELLEGTGDPGKLAATLGGLAQHATDRSVQIGALLRLCHIEYEVLKQREKALNTIRRASELGPENDEVWQRFEDIARTSGSLDTFVEALGTPASSANQRRLARSLRELGRDQEAVTVLSTLAFGTESDPVAFQELDELLRSRAEPEELRTFYGKRIERAEGSERIEHLFELAELEEDAFSEPNRALELYGRILEVEPESLRALRSASRLAIAEGNAERALEFLGREHALSEGELRAQRAVDMARVHLEMRKAPKDALAALEPLLEGNAYVDLALPMLQPMLTLGEVRSRVAEYLLTIYRSREQFAEQPELLSILIATRASKADRSALYSERALVLEKLDRTEEAFETLVQAVKEVPAESSIWFRFYDLAKSLGKQKVWSDALELALPESGAAMPEAVALELAFKGEEEAIASSDSVRVLRYGARILASHPNDVERLERIATLLDESGRTAEAATHYERLRGVDPAHTRAQARLLDIYEASGQVDLFLAVALVRLERSELSDEDTKLLRLRGLQLFAAHAPDHASHVLWVTETLIESPAETRALEAAERFPSEATFASLVQGLVVRAGAAMPALDALFARCTGDRKVSVAQALVAVEEPGAARAQRLVALAKLQVEKGRDDARVTLERATAEDENNLEAWSLLDGIYTAANETQKLRACLARLEALETAPEKRALLLTRRASMALGASDYDEAIEIYSVIVDDYGLAELSVRPLVELLRAKQRHGEVTSVLERQLAANLGDVPRGAVALELARHLREPAHEYRRALEVLTELTRDGSPSEEVLAELDRLLEAPEPQVRHEAATLLRTVHEGSPERQRKALGVLVETTDALDEKLALIERVVTHDPTAFDWCLRALPIAADADALVAWFDRGAAGARTQGSLRLYAEQAAMLELGDPANIAALHARLGSVLAFELTLPSEGLAYLEGAEAQGRTEVRADLARIYRERGDHVGLDRVLGALIEDTAEANERRRLVLERAALVVTVDREKAIGLYEDAIALERDDATASALEALYESMERWGDLIGLLESGLEQENLAVPERVRLLSKLAKTCEHVGEPERMMRTYVDVLALDPKHADARAALSALGTHAELGLEAAELLEEALVRDGDWQAVAALLKQRVERETAAEEKAVLLSRLSEVCETRLADVPRALDLRLQREALLAEEGLVAMLAENLQAVARLLASGGSREQVAQYRMERVRRDAPMPELLAAALLEDARTLEGLQRDDDALVLYLRVEALGETDAAFAAVDRILERQEKHDERIRHLQSFQGDSAAEAANYKKLAGLLVGKLGRDEDAIAAYESCLERRPDDAEALRALEQLLTRTGRMDALRSFLERPKSLEDEVRIRLALAAGANAKGDRAQAALELRELVDAVGPTDARIDPALTLLEELSGQDGELPLDVLEEVYRKRQDVTRLEGVLRRRASRAEGEERVTQTMRLAELLEATEPRRALDELKPMLGVTRDLDVVCTQMEAIADRHNLWDVCAAAYDETALQDGEAKIAMLRRAARIHDVRRSDPQRALAVFSALKAAGAGDLETIEAIDRLATQLSDWKVLDSALVAKVELLDSNTEKAATWRRIGEHRRARMADPTGAAVAYETSLELEESAGAMDQLLEMYEGAEDRNRTLALLRRRAELSQQDDDRLRFIDRAATLCESMGDHHQAIELRESAPPGDAVNSLRLLVLYGREKMWDEWLGLVRSILPSVSGVSEKVALLEEEGRLRMSHAQDAAGALSAYREALELEYREDTLRAFVECGPQGEQLAFAESLARREKANSVLARILQVRAEASSDDAERAALWTEAASLTESRSLAIGYLTRAARSSDFSAESLNLLEARVAEASEDAKIGYLALLEEEALARSDMRIRLGRFRLTVRKDPEGAAKEFERAIAASPRDVSLLVELEGIYESMGDVQSVLRIGNQRLALTDDGAARAELLLKLAERGAQEDPISANSRAEEALRIAPAHDGARAFLMRRVSANFAILDDVVRALPSVEPLKELFDARIARANEADERERFRMLYAERLAGRGDVESAFGVLRDTCAENPFVPNAATELERLARAHGWLDQFDATMTQGLRAHAEIASSAALGNMWAHLAKVREEQGRADAPDAFEKAAEAMPKNVEIRGQWADSLERLSRFDEATTVRIEQAKLSKEPSRVFQEVYRKSSEEQLRFQDADRVLAAALEREPNAAWALRGRVEMAERLGQRPSGEWMRSLANVVSNDVESLRWRMRAAQTFEERGEIPAAITLYEEALRTAPEREDALSALRRLLSQQPREYAVQLLQSVRPSLPPDVRISRLCEVALLQEDALADEVAAVETYRNILKESPDHEEARKRLYELLRRAARSVDLAEFLELEVSRPEASADKVLELARLYEGPLADPARAIALYERASALPETKTLALTALGTLYEGRREYTKASDALQRLSLAPAAASVEIFRKIAALSERSGDVASATVALEHAAEMGDVDARIELERTYEKGADWPRLSALYEKELAAGSSRENVVRRKLAGLYFDKLEQTERAASLLESLPEDRDALGMLAEAYEKLGRIEAAATTWHRVIQLHTNKRTRDVAMLHQRVAILFSKMGRDTDALAELESAFRIEPGNVRVLRSIAELSMKLGDLERSQKTLRSLLLQKIDATGPLGKGRVFFSLGEIAEKQGDKAKAIQMYERAHENDRDLTDALERIKGLR